MVKQTLFYVTSSGIDTVEGTLQKAQVGITRLFLLSGGGDRGGASLTYCERSGEAQ